MEPGQASRWQFMCSQPLLYKLLQDQPSPLYSLERGEAINFFIPFLMYLIFWQMIVLNGIHRDKTDKRRLWWWSNLNPEIGYPPTSFLDFLSFFKKLKYNYTICPNYPFFPLNPPKYSTLLPLFLCYHYLYVSISSRLTYKKILFPLSPSFPFSLSSSPSLPLFLPPSLYPQHVTGQPFPLPLFLSPLSFCLYLSPFLSLYPLLRVPIKFSLN